MTLISSSAYILFTYWLSGTIVFFVILRFLNHDIYRRYYKLIYILALGTGPITIAWILEKIMYISVGHTALWYISVLCLMFFALAGYGLKDYRQTFRILIEQFSKSDVLISVLLLFVLLFNILLPVIGNDACQYYYVSRNIYEAMDFHCYPQIASDTYKGYFPWTHPAGYVSLLTWGYLFSNGTEHLYLPKTVNVFYAYLTYMLIAELLKRYGATYAKIGALLIFMSPLYCLLISMFHIDVFRIFLFFVPFVWLSIALKEKDVKILYVIMVSLGFAAYAHSIGILAIFFAGVLVLMYLRELLTWQRMFMMAGILVVMLASRYYQNYQLFGYIVGDKSTIWALDFIHYDDFLAKTRELDGLYNVIWNGVFRGFTHPRSFAFTFQYIAIVSFVTLIYDAYIRKDMLYTFKSLLTADTMFKISLWVLALWYFLTILSTLLGGYNFIKNDRYLLTIYPFIIYVSLVLSLEIITPKRQ